VKINVKGPVVTNDDKFAYDFYGMEAVSPKDVQSLIDKANGETLDVYINSPGGNIFSGTEIYEALRSYRGAVMVHVIWAASAASVIAEAGQSEISPTGMFMLHNVAGGAQGDYNTMDTAKNILITANKAMSKAYQLKTGKSEQELLAMMNKSPDNMGTWLTAEEAVAQGFIDKISESQNIKLVASFDSQMLPQPVIDKLRNQIKNPQAEKQADFLQTKINFLKVKVKY
jgi:ATP-dependent protease ClpP protease subunit